MYSTYSSSERRLTSHSAIPISYKLHAASICILRNYAVRHEQTLNLTIAEALMATMATPPLFTSTPVYKGSTAFECIGAELTLSNPTQEMIAEAHGTFGADKRVACLLSLGSGHPGIFSTPDKPSVAEWNRFLEGLVMDAERKAQTLEFQMGHLGIYYRFSVGSGLERTNPSTVMGPGGVIIHTQVYIGDAKVSKAMGICTGLLRTRDGVITLGQLSKAHPRKRGRDILNLA